MKHVFRYHPLLVALHWLLAALIVAALAIGFFGLATTPNSDPQKMDILQLHMAGGMLILALMCIRFIVRLRTSRPENTAGDRGFLKRITQISQYGFYVLVLSVAMTGYTTAILAGLPEIVFSRSGDPLPPSLLIYPTRIAHGYLAVILAGLILLHLFTVLYHQFVVKDGLFRRMSFGRHASGAAVPTE